MATVMIIRAIPLMDMRHTHGAGHMLSVMSPASWFTILGKVTMVTAIIRTFIMGAVASTGEGFMAAAGATAAAIARLLFVGQKITGAARESTISPTEPRQFLSLT